MKYNSRPAAPAVVDDEPIPHQANSPVRRYLADPIAEAAQHAASASLRGKVVLITGAASAVGAALAALLARDGVHLIVADLKQEQAEHMAAALRQEGASARAVGFDVGDARAATQAVTDVIEQFGRLDVLVNNAGNDVAMPMAELSVQQWMRVIGSNLNGPFFLSKAVAPIMAAAGTGHIFNIASTAAKPGGPDASAYHASKWGLLGLSHALHAHLRTLGIKVTAVDPGSPQAPENVARAVRSVLLMPDNSVVAEITVLPLQESAWP